MSVLSETPQQVYEYYSKSFHAYQFPQVVTQDTITQILLNLGIDMNDKRWVYELARLWITTAQLEEIDAFFKSYYNQNQTFATNMASLNIHVFHANA